MQFTEKILNKMSIKLFIILSAILLTNCAGQYQPQEGEEILSFDSKSQEPFTIKVTEGSYFTLKIKGNPTTGYGWYLENCKQTKSSIVKALNLNDKNGTDDYFSDPHPEGWVGVGGSYYFRFKALSKGNQTLTFANKRPWDESTKTLYKFEVNIN